ncbi:hypothetical protein SNEBB_005907 [Seison nebaliae]|nr:hypothetical protein SNEBB_005907 [Seison nebaliae]
MTKHISTNPYSSYTNGSVVDNVSYVEATERGDFACSKSEDALRRFTSGGSSVEFHDHNIHDTVASELHDLVYSEADPLCLEQTIKKIVQRKQVLIVDDSYSKFDTTFISNETLKLLKTKLYEKLISELIKGRCNREQILSKRSVRKRIETIVDDHYGQLCSHPCIDKEHMKELNMQCAADFLNLAKKNGAALLIQKNWRKHLISKWYRNMKKASIRIQAWWRGIMIRHHMVILLDIGNEAIENDVSLTQNLQEFQKNNFLTDTRLVHTTRKGTVTLYHIHLVTLASVSQLLRDPLLGAKTADDAKGKICFRAPHIPKKIMETLFDFMYGYRVNINLLWLEDYLSAARDIGFKELENICCDLLQENAAERAFVEERTKVVQCTDLPPLDTYDMLTAIANEGLMNFSKFSSKFRDLTPRDVRRLLASDELTVKDEFEVFRAANRWYSYDFKTRELHIPDVFMSIRWRNLPPWEIRKCVHQLPVMMKNRRLAYVITEAHWYSFYKHYEVFHPQLRLVADPQRHGMQEQEDDGRCVEKCIL